MWGQTHWSQSVQTYTGGLQWHLITDESFLNSLSTNRLRSFVDYKPFNNTAKSHWHLPAGERFSYERFFLFNNKKKKNLFCFALKIITKPTVGESYRVLFTKESQSREISRMTSLWQVIYRKLNNRFNLFSYFTRIEKIFNMVWFFKNLFRLC